MTARARRRAGGAGLVGAGATLVLLAGTAALALQGGGHAPAWSPGASTVRSATPTAGSGVGSTTPIPDAPRPTASPSSDPSADGPSSPSPSSSSPPALSPVAPPPGPAAGRATARPDATAAPAHRYALLLGASDYPAPVGEVIGGEQDPVLIRRELLRAGWLPQNIRVVTSERLTGATVRTGLSWLRQRGRSGTFSLFHVSGVVRAGADGAGALVLPGGDVVPGAEVVGALAQIDGRLWADVSAASAATLLPGLAGDRVLVSASARTGQQAYGYRQAQRSLWVTLLFGLAFGEERADLDGDGRVTADEALRWSGRYTAELTRRQRGGRQVPLVQGDADRAWVLSAPPG